MELQGYNVDYTTQGHDNALTWLACAFYNCIIILTDDDNACKVPRYVT